MIGPAVYLDPDEGVRLRRSASRLAKTHADPQMAAFFAALSDFRPEEMARHERIYAFVEMVGEHLGPEAARAALAVAVEAAKADVRAGRRS